MDNEIIGQNTSSSALVVEGGAMRGVFSAGVLDAFLKEGFNPFQLHLGVSAGAINLAAFLAGMYKRNYKVYTDYSIRPDFISWRKFITGGHLIDLDWLWDITIKEIRLDLDNIMNSGKEYYVGVTEVKTGKPLYIRPDKENLEDLLKASSSIPVLYRSILKINEMELVDGGLADPIPVIEAYNRKASNIMVLRSRPYSFNMEEKSKSFVNKLFLRKYPKLIEAAAKRPINYRKAIDFMRNPPAGVRIIEVNPPEDFRTKRLTTDAEILEQDYNLGFETGKDIIKKWNREFGE